MKGPGGAKGKAIRARWWRFNPGFNYPFNLWH
jgi:hypothetical protein